MRTPSSSKRRLDLAPPLADRFILGFPIDYGPVLLLMPFRFHLAMDTLPSEVLQAGPARHYPRFWIWRPSFERQRDFNPPGQRAAQHTLRVLRLGLLQDGMASRCGRYLRRARNFFWHSLASDRNSPNSRVPLSFAHKGSAFRAETA